MGIKGLSKFLKKQAASVMNDWHSINDYKGQQIAIDASPGMYTALTTMSSRPGDEGDNSHVLGFLTRTIKMLELGVVPVWVFDGEAPEMKSAILSQRDKVRAHARVALDEAEKKGNKKDIKKYAVRLVKATQKHNDDVIQLLQFMGLPALQAPSEAEALCAALARAGKVAGCATEDMDALCFGAPKLLRYINQAASSPKTSLIQQIDFEQISAQLGFNFDEFIDFCILCGCDYLGTIQYVGPQTALKLMSEHRSIENVLQHIDRHINAVPEPWDYQHVRDWFKNPPVGELERYDFTRSAPQMSRLKGFLESHGLKEHVVEEYLQRLDAIWSGLPPPPKPALPKLLRDHNTKNHDTKSKPLAKGQTTLAGLFSSKRKDSSATSSATPAKKPRLNGSCASLFSSCPAHELFIRQVHQTPDAKALICGRERDISYANLDLLTTSMSAKILESIQPGSSIALLMERSLEAIVAMLGVLKAGCCYVPLNLVDEPQERLRAQVDMAQIKLGISGPSANCLGAVQIGIDRVIPVNLSEHPSEAILPQVAPSSPMLILFTSGSTGSPKAVQLSHQAALLHVHHYMREFQISAADVSANMSELIFDMHVSEIFPFLGTGGSICTLPARATFEARSDLMQKGITCSMWVPSVLRSYLDLQHSMPKSMRLAFLAGEVLTADLVDRIFEATPNSELQVVNAYGPTETHVVTAQRLTCQQRHAGSIPIGRAVNDVQLFVVDDNGQDILGEGEGELWVSGPCLADGYLGDPVQTSAKFVEHGSQRVYKTGDLVCWGAESCLHFIGRKDTQVKLNGRRIEIEGIEDALRKIGNEDAVVVMSKRDKLVAFILGAFNAEMLEERCRASLPAYMVPDSFRQYTGTWPRTASGKIDRRQLVLEASEDSRHCERDLSSMGDSPLKHREIAKGSSMSQAELRIATVVAEVVGLTAVESIDASCPLREYLNSLQAMVVAQKLQKSQSFIIQPVHLVSGMTIAELALGNFGAAPTLLMRLSTPRETSGNAIPILMCPGAFGRPTNLSRLAQKLQPLGRCWGFAIPEDNGSRPSSVSDLAKMFIQEASAILNESTSPCIVIGQSFGSCVAVELALQLEQKCKKVATVFALDPRNDLLDDNLLCKKEVVALRALLQSDQRWLHLNENLQHVEQSSLWGVVEDYFGRTEAAALQSECKRMVATMDYCNSVWSRHVQHSSLKVPLYSLMADEEKLPDTSRLRQLLKCGETELHVSQVPGNHFSIAMHQHASAAANLIMKHSEILLIQ